MAVDPTLASIKAAVAVRGYDQASADLVSTINDAYREVLGAYRWPFLDARSTSLALAAGTAQVSLTGIADLLHVDAVRIVGGECDLDFVPAQELRTRLNASSDRSAPRQWTRHGNDLFVYPTPDTAITLAIDYAPQPPALAADGDLLLIPAEYASAVTWGACAIFAFRQRDWSAAGAAEQKRDDAVRRAIGAYSIHQRQSSRQVKSGYWGQPR